ncbi:MAG: aminodeoxychorismate synthase component I [Spirochaetota bacterium]
MLLLDADFVDTFNTLFRKEIPFVFVIDFDGKYPVIFPVHSAGQEEILYDFHSDGERFTNTPDTPKAVISYSASHVCWRRYQSAFRYVQDQLNMGESYLANLTFPSRFHTDATLSEIYHASRAPYRLCYKNRFTVFSPERFIRIDGGHISTNPMKGTIDASLPDARKRLMDDMKEAAEHLTIVDLLRNDLSRVCSSVEVTRYRYCETIRSYTGELVQTSSLIRGMLHDSYIDRPAHILQALLPAGSVTGATKKRTIEIIKHAEGYDRGYYTGIFGFCRTKVIDSAVIIRYIENHAASMFFKSGGGITVYSNPVSEYEEMKNKVYVPVC